MTAIGTLATCRRCGDPIRLCPNGLWGHIEARWRAPHYASPRRETT